MNKSRPQLRLCWLYCLAQAMLLLLYSGGTQASQFSALCQSQIEQIQDDTILKSRAFGGLVQQNLAVIYQSNTLYQMDVNISGEQLSDGKVGRITNKWLGYFCNEFNLASNVSSNNEFVTNMLSALLTVAQLTEHYPLWRQVIVSGKFNQWFLLETNKKQMSALTCSPWPAHYGTPMQLYNLVDKYYQQGQQQELVTTGLSNCTQAVNMSVAMEDNMSVVMEDKYYRLDANDIETLGSMDNLSSDQLKLLTQLSGQVFANIYLFQVALNDLLPAERGSALFQNQGLEELYKLAQKSDPLPKETSNPLLWRGTPGCGCAKNITLEGNNTRFYYGFYQYWQPPHEATIDYSQLTRMAYFSASIENNKVTTPSNWQANNPNAQFIVNAHNHRVKVDLVFSNIPSQLSKPQIPTLYNDDLISQIVTTVKTPIEGYTINKLKPMMSFGESPRRTMADGVTLNLDLSELKTAADMEAFIVFIKKLKRQLNPTTSNTMADIEDPYYLNILVPAYDLIANNASFYTINNLNRIEPDINLFIMNFAPLAISEQRASNKQALVEQKSISSADHRDGQVSSSTTYKVSLLKTLRTELGDKQYSEIAGKIFNKSIPLINVNDDLQELEQVLNYTKWSYQGAAFWSYPLLPEVSQLINNSYFASEEMTFSVLASTVNLATQICNTLCPQRWLLRVVFFCLVILVCAYAFASIWLFSLRKLFRRWYFLLFMFVSAVFIMLVFSCDPYWKEQQQLFIFIFILIVLAANVIRQREINNRSNLP